MNYESALTALTAAHMANSGRYHNPCITVNYETGMFDFQSEFTVGDTEMVICSNVDCWDNIGLDGHDAEMEALAGVDQLLDTANTNTNTNTEKEG